jgi:hypothetical protein
MSKKLVQRVVFVLVLLALLVASFLAGRMDSRAINVQAQEEPVEEDRATSTHTCNVWQVAIFSNRAHILCKTSKLVGTDTVWFFAVENTSANKTLINRMMAIGLTQMSLDHNVVVYFDTLSANNPPGCLAADCRKLIGIVGED